MASKDRANYLSQRRDALKLVSVTIEKDALEQLDDVLRAEGETRSAWIRRMIYDKIQYQKKSGLGPTGEVHITCPHCGRRADSRAELEQRFGWRTVNGSVIPQSWCRQCRGK